MAECCYQTKAHLFYRRKKGRKTVGDLLAENRCKGQEEEQRWLRRGVSGRQRWREMEDEADQATDTIILEELR